MNFTTEDHCIVQIIVVLMGNLLQSKVPVFLSIMFKGVLDLNPGPVYDK